MSKQSTVVSADQVSEYLQQYPDFFHDHLNLLENLSIPHPSGSATSLILKQLELLRANRQELECQLNDLLEIARNNDISFIRMHKLTLALLEASTLAEIVANLNAVMAEYFMTDFVAVRIIKQVSNPIISDLFIEPGSDDLLPFLKQLASNQPKCGRATLAQAKVLFGDAAIEVKSCAIIPMSFTELDGILAIGSRNADRFHHSMGNLFLTQMSEIIGTRFIALLNKADVG
ncbi:MAG: DUF484 family protein [Methylococcales bacterium]|jgi:uncharacterized protein YigA (DUF484 family)|nr:MAG: DUF484 family protein [Methylococcales bacterium]